LPFRKRIDLHSKQYIDVFIVRFCSAWEHPRKRESICVPADRFLAPPAP
jgi:hypothetical protein